MHQAVISTSYFPNIDYARALKDNDQIIIDHGENFIKQSNCSRAYVLGPNSVLKLIVPLQKWRNNTPIRDIRISYDEDWQKIHWKTLEACYRSSPYFEYYEDKLDAIINGKKHDFLIDLNVETLNFVLSVLKLETEVNHSNLYIQTSEVKNDYRNKLPRRNGENDHYKEYVQVFGESKFFANLSLIDLICSEGPNAIYLL